MSSDNYLRPIARISSLNTVRLHLRNPWVCAFFSFSFPGFGNLLQNRYIKGFLLILWELFINAKAKINLGIFYSMSGDFAKAKEVVDLRWVFFYAGIYIYAIWDSYRGTVDLNRQYLLALQDEADLPVMAISDFDINYVDRRIPWVGALWSCFIPGLGQLYAHKVISGVFLFVLSIVILYQAHLQLAYYDVLLGDFTGAKHVLDVQWAMYYPSFYTFICYDAYVSAVEQNKLFQRIQSRMLRSRYQRPEFPMPI